MPIVELGRGLALQLPKRTPKTQTQRSLNEICILNAKGTLETRNQLVKFIWIRGHKNIQGNTIADQEAREALHLSMRLCQPPCLPHIDLNHSPSQAQLNAWRKYHDEYPAWVIGMKSCSFLHLRSAGTTKRPPLDPKLSTKQLPGYIKATVPPKGCSGMASGHCS
ncbi:hypothetical protein GE061_004282 [Apolygus lucorum]|uniref:RNase H type-1 domain-containing protein n=1 Tax=Apolygus lucorum TaxID=248454 RepID=A0A8S9X1D5_APOLU|nr:hypothetical protein GE061_004282 [Apolygus lucorum]